MNLDSELRAIVKQTKALLQWEDTLHGGRHGAGVAMQNFSARLAGAAVDPLDTSARLLKLAEQAASCTQCPLHQERSCSVFARGSAQARVAFVGEGPGYHEDQQGVPFVGPAGQLLDKMIAAMGYQRDQVYICNVVKCRPPNNRTPLPEEALACRPFLEQQLQLVAPDVIVALGRCAAENLGCAGPETRGWRGVWGSWQERPVMPTYHPAFLLRNPEHKRVVWQDLQAVMLRLSQDHVHVSEGAP